MPVHPMPPGHRYKVDGWLEERTLGSGGFGTVVLWKNEENGNYLAVKRCTLHGEMSSKLKQRWILECDIMLRLDHDNVIKAYPLPPELDIRDSDLPLLAMEYCEGGDLRKVLNKPENANGLGEYNVRNIIQDVASAIEYLHSKRIIHRDLKPENIVIQSVDEKLVYKLIDLGYAKDLDQGSVCTSFVGTMQYLAPELFMSQKYTCTVDYWSFGVLAFECCAGFRPFFHSVPPIKWQNDVARKQKEDIHAFMQDGKIVFSKNIPQPNHLCRTSRFYIEQWLRYMLLWDPRDRGGGLMVAGRPRCFALLENILKTKLLQVLIVPRNEMLTYPVADSKVLLSDVMTIIEQETSIPVAEQELLLASGTTADPNGEAVLCLPEMPNGESDEWIVFLFDKRDPRFPARNRKLRTMPPKVNDMVNEARTLTMYQEKKVSWGHSFYYSRQVRKEYDRLIAAQRALMLCLLRFHSNFSKLQGDLNRDIASLQSKIEFFQKCQDYDISKYNDQAKTGISSEKMFNNWDEIGNQVTKFASLQAEVARIDSSCTIINQMVMELNRSPYSRSKAESSLKDMEDEALQLYTKLRHTAPENRNKEGNTANLPMVQLVLKVVSQRNRLTEDLYLHMEKVVHCKNELLTLLPKIKSTLKTINEAGKRLVGYQLQRQKDMWQLVSVALKQGKALQSKNNKTNQKVPNSQLQPTSTTNHHPQPLEDQSLQSSMQNYNLHESPSQRQMIGRSLSGASQGSAGSSMSQSNFVLNQYAEKSVNLISQNHDTRNRLETMLLSFHQDNLQKTDSEDLDWEFLDRNKSNLRTPTTSSASKSSSPLLRTNPRR